MKKLVVFAVLTCLLFSFALAIADDSSSPATANNETVLETQQQVCPRQFEGPGINPATLRTSSGEYLYPQNVVADQTAIKVPEAPYIVAGGPSMTPPQLIDIIERRYNDNYNELDTWHLIDFDDIIDAPSAFSQTVRLYDEYTHMGVTFYGTGEHDGGAVLNELSNFGVTGHSSPNFLCFNVNLTMEDGGIPQGPEYIYFDDPVSEVRMLVGSGDLWPAEWVYLDCWDVDDNYLGWSSIYGDDIMQELSYTADNIGHVMVSFTGDYLVIDDLEWNTMEVEPGGSVALIKDHTSFWGNGNEESMIAMGVDYDVIASADVAATDLSGYTLVIVEGNQNDPFNANLNAATDHLAAYVAAGGWLQYHGGTNDHGTPWVLWDGTTEVWDDAAYNDFDNWSVVPDHPILEGTVDPLEGAHANHGYVDGYPEEAVVITETTDGYPTTVEYSYGNGMVIVSTMTLEYLYNFYGDNAGLIVPNLINYGLYRGILVLGTTTIETSVLLAMDNLGIPYHHIQTNDWENVDLNSYQTVLVAMDGGIGGVNDMQAIVDYCTGGGTLYLIGGSNSATFSNGMQDIVDHTGLYGWDISATPHLTITDPLHPLVQGLPNTYDFVDEFAAYYVLEFNDPLAAVGAENGDGWPILLTKNAGAGVFKHFANSARDIYWTDPGDFDILETIIDNMFEAAASPLFLSATPVVDPTIINPPTTFGWNAFVQNVSGGPYTFDAWTALTLPWGMPYGPLDLFTGITLPDGGVLVAVPNQFVPGFAPPGVYTYHAVVGDYWAGDIVAEQTFPFTVIVAGPTVAGTFDPDGWVLTDFIEVDELDTPELSNAVPTDYKFETPYPNPFNPTTTVSIGLPEVSSLTVVVTNVLGQTVAILANDYFDAGYHQFTFDAHGLSSGLYFVHALVPGELNQVQKVMLVR